MTIIASPHLIQINFENNILGSRKDLVGGDGFSGTQILLVRKR